MLQAVCYTESLQRANVVKFTECNAQGFGTGFKFEPAGV